MGQQILRIALSMLLLFNLTPAVHAVEAVQIVDNSFQQITISLNNESVLRVTGAAGEVLQIYNVAGVRVLSVRIDSSDKSFNLNLPKGCYIVKVGKVVRKISIG
ncbi:MAG: T9SS type A sorting domain-containing protein [Prevotella sp.]|jgi:hypothetical protein